MQGTRDFFPEDQRVQSWLFEKWHKSATLFGFEQYDAPVVESEELFIRKAGEEITDQLYNFEDKSGRRLSLRPEMTPSLTRMVLSKGKSLAFPLKWYSIPQCWRYEKMTRGRRRCDTIFTCRSLLYRADLFVSHIYNREHYQWNMDIWGVDTVDAEAELLAALVYSMQLMGLSSADAGIKVSCNKFITTVQLSVSIRHIFSLILRRSTAEKSLIPLWLR